MERERGRVGEREWNRERESCKIYFFIECIDWIVNLIDLYLFINWKKGPINKNEQNKFYTDLESSRYLMNEMIYEQPIAYCQKCSHPFLFSTNQMSWSLIWFENNLGLSGLREESECKLKSRIYSKVECSTSPSCSIIIFSIQDIKNDQIHPNKFRKQAMNKDDKSV